MTNVIVSSCNDCPSKDETKPTGQCQHPDKVPGAYIKRDCCSPRFITPNWCPLRGNTVMVIFSHKTHDNEPNEPITEGPAKSTY